VINDSLTQEVEALRREVEQFRRSEVERLQRERDDAVHAAEHYRAEALRNAEIGRKIHAELQERITNLEAQLKVAQQLPNGRPTLNRK
jgi:predicted RNase H-like nuclease (RuvC/YqgF family)